MILNTSILVISRECPLLTLGTANISFLKPVAFLAASGFTWRRPVFVEIKRYTANASLAVPEPEVQADI